MNEKIGYRIKELRVKNQMKQIELANHLYVTPQAVNKWEAGKNAPDISMLIKLSELFNTTVDYILRGKDEKLTYCYIN